MPWKDDESDGRVFYAHVYRDDDCIFWAGAHATRWLEDLLTVFRPTTEEARVYRSYWLTQINIAKQKLDREDRK